MIIIERINSQLSLLCEKAIASVDPGEGDIDAPGNILCIAQVGHY